MKKRLIISAVTMAALLAFSSCSRAVSPDNTTISETTAVSEETTETTAESTEETASKPYDHTFNPHCLSHIYVDKYGKSHPNYHYEDIIGLFEAYKAAKLDDPAVVIDTNHANSGKKYEEQIRIAKEVLHNAKINGDIRRAVKGLMIESYIEDGCQKVEEGVYGKSITDPCLGWEKTERLIFDIAECV